MVYSTDRCTALVLPFVALWFILRGDLFYVLPCVILFLYFSVLLALRLTISLGEERADHSAFRTFVRFVLVWFCLFPFPLGVWEGLRFVIVAFPGLFPNPLFLPCVILFLCSSVLIALRFLSCGRERTDLSAFRTFVQFVLVWFCRFPLPLGVWEGLRFVIVAFPGLFSYPFFYLVLFFLCFSVL